MMRDLTIIRYEILVLSIEILDFET